MFQTRQDLLVVNDLAFERELGEACCRCFDFRDMIEDNEAGPPEAPRQNLPLGARTSGNGCPGRIRGRAALDHASAQPHGSDGGIDDRTAGVVEENVVAIRAGGSDRRPEVGGLPVIDHLLIAEARLCQRNFLR
jgi:hypothetical protein